MLKRGIRMTVQWLTSGQAFVERLLCHILPTLGKYERLDNIQGTQTVASPN